MSTAPVSSQPPEIGAKFYHGSWPFRGGRVGQPTQFLKNCSNWITLQQRLPANDGCQLYPKDRIDYRCGARVIERSYEE